MENEVAARQPWIDEQFASRRNSVLLSYGIDEDAAKAVKAGDPRKFVRAREKYLIELEHKFQTRVGVRHSDRLTGAAPIDTD